MHKIILYGDEVVFYLNIRNQITRVNNCYCSGVVTLLWVIVCKDISYTVNVLLADADEDEDEEVPTGSYFYTFTFI